jgi:hypothetical protein
MLKPLTTVNCLHQNGVIFAYAETITKMKISGRQITKKYEFCICFLIGELIETCNRIRIETNKNFEL